MNSFHFQYPIAAQAANYLWQMFHQIIDVRSRVVDAETETNAAASAGGASLRPGYRDVERAGIRNDDHPSNSGKCADSIGL